MAKNCSCQKPIPNFDGTCTKCGYLLNWERDMDWENVPAELSSDTKIPSKLAKEAPTPRDINSDLFSAANEVVRFSRVFKSLGDVLNVFNYIVIGIALILLLAMVLVGSISGWLFLGSVLVIIIVWVISWIQSGILRGMSSFFLMRGLRELKDSTKN
jgi:hypothetical protein